MIEPRRAIRRGRLQPRPRSATLAPALALLACATLALPAAAQPRVRHGGPVTTGRPPPPAPATSDEPADLRARFGVDRARHLLRSSDPEDRLRGIERASASAAPEAVAVLIQQLDAASTTHADARARVAIARGLAPHAEEAAARAALLQIVEAAIPRSQQRADAEDALAAPRIELARRIAALALAESGEAHAVDSLTLIARGTGAGNEAAAAALIAYPPAGTAVWMKPISATTARLAARTGDRRALGALLEAAGGDPEPVPAPGSSTAERAPARSALDAPTRAAALEALATLGDARALRIATAALTDDDPRLRVAATTALVRLGAPEAARAVEQLLADDATAGRAIELAMVTHGLGIVHALAARAAIAADLAVRTAAVAALGRDPSDAGIEALTALVADPMLRADAADAIARSPSRAAMAAIERLAAARTSRRLAARAYVIRAHTRGDASRAMERGLVDLARSPEGGDRAVGAFGQIVLGEADASRWIDDPEPAVRRAAAMATLGLRARVEASAKLAARRAHEDDAPTRTVLGLALLDGDPSGRVPTRVLRGCARGGGADVPLCTFALLRRAARSDAEHAEDETALLASSDPMVRAHAARGLGQSEDPARGGRLLAAYAYEPDPLVRRALLDALSGLSGESPSLADTLALASRLDPDPEIRWAAARIRTGKPPASGDETAIAWIHLVDATGASPAAGATAALLRADGLAVPIAFDADGDALVPGVPPGDARLVLAPRLDAAYAPTP